MSKFINFSSIKYNPNFKDVYNYSKKHYVKMDPKELNKLVKDYQEVQSEKTKLKIFNAVVPLLLRIVSKYEYSSLTSGHGLGEVYFLFDRTLKSFDISRGKSFSNLLIMMSLSLPGVLSAIPMQVGSFSTSIIRRNVANQIVNNPEMSDEEAIYNASKKLGCSIFTVKQALSIDTGLELDSFITTEEGSNNNNTISNVFMADDGEYKDEVKYLTKYVNIVCDSYHFLNYHKQKNIDRLRNIAIGRLSGLSHNEIAEMYGISNVRSGQLYKDFVHIASDFNEKYPNLSKMIIDGDEIVNQKFEFYEGNMSKYDFKVYQLKKERDRKYKINCKSAV